VPKTSARKSSVALRARIRIQRGGEIALGPGKAELLERIRQTGSIAEAAKGMGMSYMRAWTLIKTMNRCFKKPLIRAVRGGKQGGGAELTATGQTALTLYQEMEAASLAAARSDWERMRALLRPAPPEPTGRKP
jgi:molybdate transport system regulatory protein